MTKDNKTLISSGFDGTIRIWSLITFTCEAVLSDHKGTINNGVSCVCFKENIIVSGGYDGRIRVWNKNSQCLDYEFDSLEHDKFIDRKITCIKFFNQGDKIAYAGKDGSIRIWNLKLKIIEAVLFGHNYYVADIFISPDNQILVSGASDSAVFVWSVKNKGVLNSFDHKTPIKNVCISNDTRWVASTDFFGIVKIWNLMKNSLYLEFLAKEEVFSCRFYQNNKYFVFCCSKIIVLKLKNNFKLFYKP